MSGLSLPVRADRPAPVPPTRRDDAPLSAWLRGSLSRQYDAVLAEELPRALLALTEGSPVGR
jgi:hypothetical protein